MNPAMNSALNSGMAPVATPWFFYVLAVVAVASGVAVITRRNAVHAALALIVALLAVAGLYLMLYAPFVAGVQIIVYAGGKMCIRDRDYGAPSHAQEFSPVAPSQLSPALQRWVGLHKLTACLLYTSRHQCSAPAPQRACPSV